MTADVRGAWTVDSASGVASCDRCGREWTPLSDAQRDRGNASRACATHARSCK